MSGRRKPGEPNEDGGQTGNGVPESEAGSAVFFWLSGPLNAVEVCHEELPGILGSLIGDHGCRVLIGTTEDLTSFVLRVYHGDKSLGLFPKSADDWKAIGKWVTGPTLIDDIGRYGEEVQENQRRRRRR
jgi:hypothetical protein